MEDLKHVTKDMIKQDLVDLGIVKGDIVFFHSSMKTIGWVEGGADAVLDAFLETIGDDGTLVLPGLCMYDFATMNAEAIQKAWDIHNTPTYTGKIPETFRNRPGVVRSDNATHSVTAIGKYAQEITKDHKIAYGGEWATGRPLWASPGSFGHNSPWDKLYRLDAKYLLIGVDFHNCTLIHHVQIVYLEDVLKKDNPAADWPVLDFRKMGKRLEDRGIVKYGKIGAAETKLISSKAMIDTAMQVLLEEGPSLA